jgi:hypothetical protein
MGHPSETREETMKGNQNGVKLKDPDVRQRAYKAYCDWLAKGKTKRSFSFIEGDYYCIWETIESYMKTHPAEFDSKKRDAAYAQGCAIWEEIVDETGKGKNKKSSVPCLNMIMRNKYKWDTTAQINDPAENKADLNRFCEMQEVARGVYTVKPPEDRSSEPVSTSPAPVDSSTAQ